MERKPQKAWWMPAILIFIRISSWIALPIIIALIAGKYLDRRFGTEPVLFMGLTASAFIISIIGIVKVSKSYIANLEKETMMHKQETENQNDRKQPRTK